MKKQTKISVSSKKKYQAELDVPPIRNDYKGSNKLENHVALITGGDSGIGRSVAIHYAREGADVAIVYLKSDDDAKETQQLVEGEGRKCLLIKGDISKEAVCKRVVKKTVDHFGQLTILVNNAGTHEDDKQLQDISSKQLIRTFEVNIFSFFYMSSAALEVMPKGSSIINTTSVTAYRGSGHLIDYSATKGAIVTFTRSLAENLAKKGIRVNGVAPGPIWTPLVVYSFDNDHLKKFGKDTPLGRAGYPHEVAPAYVYLASADSSYVTGQVIHINGGDTLSS
jgi:NAD(P)-dependent dehydrogenase (short-subunit alcohol dehydrogenase family)